MRVILRCSRPGLHVAGCSVSQRIPQLLPYLRLPAPAFRGVPNCTTPDYSRCRSESKVGTQSSGERLPIITRMAAKIASVASRAAMLAHCRWCPRRRAIGGGVDTGGHTLCDPRLLMSLLCQCRSCLVSHLLAVTTCCMSPRQRFPLIRRLLGCECRE